MDVDFSKLLNEQIHKAKLAALEAKDAVINGGHLKISDPYKKAPCAFIEGYGSLDSIPPTMHVKKTCYSEFSRYPDQVEELKKRMSAKRDAK